MNHPSQRKSRCQVFSACGCLWYRRSALIWTRRSLAKSWTASSIWSGCFFTFARKYLLRSRILRTSYDFRVAFGHFSHHSILWRFFNFAETFSVPLTSRLVSLQALRERLNNRQDLGEAMADTVRLGEGPHWKQCLACSIPVLSAGLKSELHKERAQSISLLL